MLYRCRYFILFVVAVWWFYYMVKDEYNRLMVDPIYKNEGVQESVENIRNESMGFMLFLAFLYMCVIILPTLFLGYHSIPGFPEPKKPVDPHLFFVYNYYVE
jgi:hypothetical protein